MLRYKTSTIEQTNNGIVCFRAEADDLYDESDLMAILDLMEQAADGKPFLLIMIVNKFEFLMTKEARKLFQHYEKAQKLIKAEAVVINSRSTKILYNLLTMVNKPKFPFKAFTSEQEAIAWLLRFKA